MQRADAPSGQTTLDAARFLGWSEKVLQEERALHRLPVKIVTFNNSSLGMVKLEMLASGLPDFENDHARVDYAAIATAAGIHAVRIEDPKDVRAGLEDALRHEEAGRSAGSRCRSNDGTRRHSSRYPDRRGRALTKSSSPPPAEPPRPRGRTARRA